VKPWARNNDAETLIVHRGEKAAAVVKSLSLHLRDVMIVPVRARCRIELCEPGALNEMMRLAQRYGNRSARELQPDRHESGNEFGRAAGAGVVGHLHLHALPRWIGDSNFMTVMAETRVHPEDLKNHLRASLQSLCLIREARCATIQYAIQQEFGRTRVSHSGPRTYGRTKAAAKERARVRLIEVRPLAKNSMRPAVFPALFKKAAENWPDRSALSGIRRKAPASTTLPTRS